MSIASYSDLTTAAANWAGRSDLTSRIPEFIVLAEAKMNRKLRELEMVTKNATFSITGEYVAVPTSFGGVKTFYLNTTDKANLQYATDEYITQNFPSGTGQPKYYDVQGTNFRFGPAPDVTYSATLVYFLMVPALTGSATTNWVITSYPDAYLYGVMAELSAYLKDFQSAQNWVTAMYQVFDEMKQGSKKTQFGGAPIVSRPG